MELDRELETYRRELPGLLAHEGKFVLIHGDVVSGIFDTREQALQAGYDRFGLDVFLAKQIAAKEKPLYFSRNIRQCPT